MFEFLKKISQTARRALPHRADAKAGQDIVFWVDMPPIPDAPVRNAPVRNPVAQNPVAQNPVTRTPADESSTSYQSQRVSQAVACGSAVTQPDPPHRIGSHRERLLAMKLEHLQICSVRRCQQLASAGVQTAGDLVYGNLSEIAGRLSHAERAERALRRYRAAIRMALAIDSMMPRDALLLVAIHRRSVASLSRESAAQLHRDLERFSLSTRGSKLVGHRGVPSLRRVKTWITTCRSLVELNSTTNAQPALQ